MTQATSPMTRALIGRAAEAGAVAEEAVRRFCRDGREATSAFDRDVDRLHLDDPAYRSAVDESGLGQVQAFAQRIADAVEALQTGRSA